MDDTRIENATIETDDNGHTIDLVAVVDGMKYHFEIDIWGLKDRDEEMGIHTRDYGNGLPRHKMSLSQNGCDFFNNEITANPEKG
tara:strand:+ start:62 stop:316 length:255 start_codon:yes stop_codon:yes gene_type:complete